MENKEIATPKKITQELIGGWILWGMLFGLIYSIVYSLLTHYIKSLILTAIVSLILQGLTAFLIWKFSTKSTFKKRTMSYDGVPSVMKNLIIFTVVICVINGIIQFYKVDKTIDKAVETNLQLQFVESRLSYLYNDEQMAEYNKQKEEALEKVKSQSYIYLAIMEVGIIVIHLAVLPLEKKEILKYVTQTPNLNPQLGRYPQ